MLIDVLENGYWHARSPAYTGSDFALAGVEPRAWRCDIHRIRCSAYMIAAVRAYLYGFKTTMGAPAPPPLGVDCCVPSMNKPYSALTNEVRCVNSQNTDADI